MSKKLEPYEKLEREFGEFSARDPELMVACSSGTAALHLAMEVLRAEGCMSVTIPDLTMIACPRAATLAGMDIDLADVNDEGLLDYSPDYYADCIMPVSLYGRKCNYRDQRPATDNINNRSIVEDLSEAHGIMIAPSSIGCWSFYKNKVIAGEEGGMVAFVDKEQADLARSLRCLGMIPGGNFDHIPRGMNYRLSNCHAELILKSLAVFPENLNRRREVEDLYNRHIPNDWVLTPRDIPWVYDLSVPVDVDVLVSLLNRKGIEARTYFKPISTQMEYSYDNNHKDFPKALELSESRIYLPIRPDMSDTEVAVTCKCLVNSVEKML